MASHVTALRWIVNTRARLRSVGLFVMGGISARVSFLGVTGGDQWGSVGFGVAVDKVRAVAEFVGCSWSG